MPRLLYIDVETRSALDLRTSGCSSRDYARHPLTQLLCLAFAFDDGPVRSWSPFIDGPPPRELIRFAGTAVVHGAHFEPWIYRHVLAPRFGFRAPSEWICTAALCRANGLPGDLDGAALALWASGKSARGRAAMLRFSKPRKARKDERELERFCGALFHEPRDWPDDFQELLTYNREDVEISREFNLQLVPLSATERRVFALDREANNRGVLIDLPRVRRLKALADAFKDRKRAEAVERGLENLQSNDQFIVWTAERQGAPLARVRRCLALAHKRRASAGRKEAGKAALARLAAMHGFPVNCQADYLENFLKQGLVSRPVAIMIRRKIAISASSTAKLEKLLARTSPDDSRCRENMIYHGAHTGRFAAVAVQMHNLYKVDQELLVAGSSWYETLEKHLAAPDRALWAVYGDDLLKFIRSALRSCLTAPPGKCLHVADYSAIEARVLLWLAGEREWLLKLARGEDIYKELAARVFCVPVGAVDSFQRDLGKRGELGCGYGMGAPKFQATCERAGVSISTDLSERTVSAYRTSHPRVPALWRELEQTAVRAVKGPDRDFPAAHGKLTYRFSGKTGALVCRLPSGREMVYRNARAVRGRTPWGEPCSKLLHLQPAGRGQPWKIGETYGGRLTENAVQAISRDVMTAALVSLPGAGYDYLFSSHDEIVCEAPRENLKKFVALMEAPPPWAPDLPLRAEGWTGKRYRK